MFSINRIDICISRNLNFCHAFFSSSHA